MAGFVEIALLDEFGINYCLSVGTNKYDATANLFPKSDIMMITIFINTCRLFDHYLHFPNTEINKI